MRIVQPVAAMVALAAVVGVAEAKSARVSTEGFNLSEAEDVASLHQNLARAAHRVCDDNNRETLAQREARKQCVAAALDAAVANAEIATLSALHTNLEATVRYSRGVRELNPVLVAAVDAADEAAPAATIRIASN